MLVIPIEEMPEERRRKIMGLMEELEYINKEIYGGLTSREKNRLAAKRYRAKKKARGE